MGVEQCVGVEFGRGWGVAAEIQGGTSLVDVRLGSTCGVVGLERVSGGNVSVLENGSFCFGRGTRTGDAIVSWYLRSLLSGRQCSCALSYFDEPFGWNELTR